MFTAPSFVAQSASVLLSYRRRRIGLGAAVCLAALALAGCQSRGGPGDITGSIGRSQPAQPRTAADWQAERESWGKRYDANPKDRDAAFYYARALRALDQHAQALAVLQNAVLSHQDDRELLGAYGRALADNGRLRDAAARELRDQLGQDRQDDAVAQHVQEDRNEHAGEREIGLRRNGHAG